MAVSNTLMHAILAMDVYNQGYNPGLNHGQEQIGLANLNTDSSDEFSDPNAPPGTVSPDQAASFYAVAYNYDGGTVISYRGTDDPSVVNFSSDVWTGYGVAFGSFLGEQARLASEFYQMVSADMDVDESVVLTGHSLGEATCVYIN